MARNLAKIYLKFLASISLTYSKFIDEFANGFTDFEIIKLSDSEYTVCNPDQTAEDALICNCTKNDTIVDCSNLELHYIPNETFFPSNVVELDLSNNYLQNLPDLTGYKNLSYFDFSINTLLSQHNDLRKLLPYSLTYLNISQNNLPGDLQINQNLVFLETLDVSHNGLENIYPSELEGINDDVSNFNKLSSLRNLYASYTGTIKKASFLSKLKL